MPSRRSKLIGKMIGEYEVISHIGEGGMGEVYEGRHPLIGKRVAIKTLLPQFSSDEALTQRFVAEARAVNAIRHRGIVDIFGFGKLEDGTQYCIMEFLDGMGFDVLIQRNAPMASGEVVEFVDQIVDALGAAHTAGVIHRDIKPSNVFLVDTGHGHPYVKLLDFGIAKVDALRGQQTPQTRASMIMGTPDYMAPEQVRGEPVGAPTDFYALGCMIYHMLTGHPPYAGPNAMGSMFAHLEQPVMRAGDKRPDVLPALDDLCTWMMQKAPEDRPPNATNIHGALDAMWPDLFGGPHPPRRRGAHLTLAAPMSRPRASPPQRVERATRPPLDATSLQRPSVRAPAEHQTDPASPQPLIETRAHVANVIVDPLAETVGELPLPVSAAPEAGSFTQQVKTDPVQPSPELTPAELGVSSPRRWPIFVGVALFATAATAGTLWFLNSRQVEVPLETKTIVVDAKPVEPVRNDAVPVNREGEPGQRGSEPVQRDAVPVQRNAEPVQRDAEPVQRDAVPVQKDVKPVKPVSDKPPKPKGPVVTEQMLTASMNKLEGMLRDKEAASGGEIRVMRQLLEEVRRSMAAAKDEAARKRVLSQMNQLQTQLR
ncbi:MAG: protein kinase [Myxococcaceae bacterium]|nr:protein kinase [Myxococcaceae bacterium]